LQAKKNYKRTKTKRRQGLASNMNNHKHDKQKIMQKTNKKKKNDGENLPG
jgi:hypothetical protein